MMRAWDREICEAAMSSMALVIFRVARTDLMRWRRMRSCPPAMDLVASSVARGEGVGERLERGVHQVGVGQGVGGADLLEQVGVLGAEHREQFGLVASHVLDGNRVGPPAGAGVDDHALL